MSKSKFKLLMLSAMYENGGNTTHRLLDGHSELFVYPFESQPGTKYVNDHLSSMFPLKYRWPVFPGSASPSELYNLVIDEEAKVRSRTPYVSKFRTAAFDFDDKERKALFIKYLEKKTCSRANIMEAFFVCTFRAWKNYKKTGDEKMHVGYSPIIGVDGDKIIDDYNGNGYVLHVIRNPFSAYGDTKKRPVPLPVAHYMTAWMLCQQHALYFSKKYPENFFVLRYEDIIENPGQVLGNVLKKMGIGKSKTLEYPSWNKERLKEVYPWGTVRIPTREVNLKTAGELGKAEIREIYERTESLVNTFNYNSIYSQLK